MSRVRLALAFVLIVGLFSGLLLFQSEGSASDSDMHHAVDQVHHSQTVQRETPFDYHSQDPDTAYSLFMHHSSGLALLAVGLLMLLDRLWLCPRDFTGVLIGCTWLLFGTFVFIMGDPEGWPIGFAGFIESFSMPTAGEWIQHKLLSLIPMLLGIYSIAIRRVPPSGKLAGWAAGLALLGGIGLIVHQHANHPDLDIMNLQHWLFALTSFFIAASLLVERSERVTRKSKSFFVPLEIMVLGLQLALYVE